MTSLQDAKVLFVDDEPNVLAALERAFIDESIQVFTARSGVEGLQSCELNGPFHLIISDYRMPGMNGAEFLEEVSSRWPESKRVILSGYADVAAIVAAINKGHIYKFIPKPWNDDELRLTVQHCLELYSLHLKKREILSDLQVSATILDQLPAGVIVINAAHRLLYSNKMAQLQLPELLNTSGGGVNAPSELTTLLQLTDASKENEPVSVTIHTGGRELRISSHPLQLPNSTAAILLLAEGYNADHSDC